MEPKLSLLPANSLSILAVVAFASIRLSLSRTACPLLASEAIPCTQRVPHSGESDVGSYHAQGISGILCLMKFTHHGLQIESSQIALRLPSQPEVRTT
jgi:hypothetical protein